MNHATWKWHSINCQMTPLNNGAKLLLIKFRKNYYHRSKLFSRSWYPKLGKTWDSNINPLWILKLQFVFITFLFIYVFSQSSASWQKKKLYSHVFYQKSSFFSRWLTAFNSNPSYISSHFHNLIFDY